jgi:hypothetical protein
MSPDTVFSFSNIDVPQAIAFIGFAIFTIGFFVWVAWLVREKRRRKDRIAAFEGSGRKALP